MKEARDDLPCQLVFFDNTGIDSVVRLGMVTLSREMVVIPCCRNTCNRAKKRRFDF